MLGITGRNRVWRWKAVGKHPAAADYINIHDGTPLMEAVADWITKGYNELQNSASASPGYHSWRFWLRGTQKGSLICGVGRDSSDRIGRPFPILIIGEGQLKGWEKKWTLLPTFLSKPWMRMERIAANRYEELQALANDLQQLTPPRLEEAFEPGPVDAAIENGQLTACQAELQQGGRSMIPLHNSPNGDVDMLAAQWHALLSRCCPEIPRAIFLGGSSQSSYLSVIRQPLSTTDFVKLWSV